MAGKVLRIKFFAKFGTLVLRINISAKNPPLRKAPKRCVQYFRT